MLSATVHGAGGGLETFLAGQLRAPLGLEPLYLGAAAACVVGLGVSLALRREGDTSATGTGFA